MLPPTVPPPRPLVLVVDDDDSIRKLLFHTLEPIAEVKRAANGLEALALLEKSKKPPELVITDVMMPGMDGITLAQSLRRDPRTARVPVIMLTAKGDPMDVVSGINAGARHYLTKPFTRADLLAKVKRILRLD